MKKAKEGEDLNGLASLFPKSEQAFWQVVFRNVEGLTEVRLRAQKPALAYRNGKEFFLAHGDGMGDPNRSFKFIRAMFHNRVCQWLFSALHPRWGVSFGLTWAKHSYIQHKESDEPTYMGDDREPLVVFSRKNIENHPDIDYLIFGHRHLEIDMKLARHTRLMVLGDWISQFTYAVYDGEHMFLEEYIEGESQP